MALDAMLQSSSEDVGEQALLRLHLPRLAGEVAFRKVTIAYPDSELGKACPRLLGSASP